MSSRDLKNIKWLRNETLWIIYLLHVTYMNVFHCEGKTDGETSLSHEMGVIGFFSPVLTLSYFNGASLGHYHASQNNALLPNKIIYIFIVVHKHWLILNAHKHTFKAKRSEK